jgi:oxalate---CoA ligase
VLHDWIERAAAAHGEDVYLADARGTATLTYTGLLDLARDVERRLDRAGLPAGAPIGVRLDGLVDYAAALVSIIAAGRVAVPLDPEAPDADTERSMAIAGTVAMITPGLDVNLLEDGSATPPVPAAGGIFLSTSGTTGVPKGIALREEQLMHVAASVVEAHGLTRADRGYCSLPLFHANAQVIGVLATLSAGAYLAVDRKFSFGRTGFWEVIEEHRITWINAVPAIITILSLDPPATVPAGLRFVRSASAPLPIAALHAFESAVGVPVVETYGMSEASSMITANPVDGPRKPGSVGLPAGAEVRVEAADGGGDAAAGEIGQVKIRGAGVIRAYASGGRPGVVDADGWLDTSDLGYLDADGYLFLVGRSDDVINRGGEMIYPRDIEEILVAQPGVRSVAVIGLPDALLGERPVAYIVPAQPGLRAEALKNLGAALRATCESRLSPAKQPSDFRFIKELPLGPTGKISSRALKDLVTAQS